MKFSFPLAGRGMQQISRALPSRTSLRSPGAGLGPLTAGARCRAPGADTEELVGTVTKTGLGWSRVQYRHRVHPLRWHGARRALGRPLLGDGDPQRRRGPDPPAALPPEGKANPNNHRPNTGKWRNNSLPLSAWFTAGRQIAFYSSKCLMFYQNMQMVSRTEINCTSLRLNQMPC